MNALPAISQLLNVPLSHETYQVDMMNDKPMPYPSSDTNHAILFECQKALDDTVRQHPVRLMTSVLLYHPNGYLPVELCWEQAPNREYLTQPRPNKQEPDTLIASFFERLNIQIEQNFLSRRVKLKQRVSNKPYHAISKRLTPHHTIVVFFFNKSDYASLGRETGHSRYLRTCIVNAWHRTIGIECDNYCELNPWISASDGLVINARVDKPKDNLHAMHNQLSWLAHASLGDFPITYWHY